jgi:hypothetical protein
MSYLTILKLSVAVAIAMLTMLTSCTTTKIGWGKGDGMNKQCQNKYASNRVPFNFN